MNLREIRLLRNLTQRELAERIGIASNTYNQYETGKREPDIATLQKIAAVLEVSIDELVSETPTTPKSTGGVWIPVLGRIAAGIPIGAVEEIIDYEEIPAEMAKSGEYFALEVKGDSMEPEYRNGDVLIIKKQETADTGDDVVLFVNGDDATFKRIRRDENGITIVPLNAAKYTPWYYTDEQIESLPVRILGVAVEVRRKLR